MGGPPPDELAFLFCEFLDGAQRGTVPGPDLRGPFGAEPAATESTGLGHAAAPAGDFGARPRRDRLEPARLVGSAGCGGGCRAGFEAGATRRDPWCRASRFVPGVHLWPAAIRGGCGREAVPDSLQTHSVLAGSFVSVSRGSCLRLRSGRLRRTGRIWRCTGPRRPARGTRPGCSAATRARQSVEEMAMAGTSSRLTSLRPMPSSTWPGRVTPTKCASDHSSSMSFQDRIWARASAPVMKNRSASGRRVRRSRSVSIV